MRPADHILAAIEAERLAAPWGTGVALMEARAASLDVSYGTMMGWLRDYRGTLKTGCGRKAVYTDLYTFDHGGDIFDEVARRKKAGLMVGDTPREIPTEEIRRDLIMEGYERVPSTSRINEIIADRGFREERRYVKVECTFANQQAQLDHSRSKYWQLKGYDAKRGDYIVIARAEEMSYKQDNTKLRLWYTNYIDEYSRLFLPKARAASGESLLVGLDHLSYVWLREPDEHPLIHLPFTLQTDRGSLFKSGGYKAMLKALRITPHETQEKHHNGKVERTFRTLWPYELAMFQRYGKGYTLYLEEYNALLFDLAMRFARRRHPVQRSMTRIEAYMQSIGAYPPRRADAEEGYSLHKLAFKPYKRVVDVHGTVSINNERWYVPQYAPGTRIATTGQKVRVRVSVDGTVTGELIEHHAKPFKLRPWAPNEHGDYTRAGADTYQQQLERQIKRPSVAQPLDTTAQSVKAKPQSPVLDAERPADDSLTAHRARVMIGARLSRHGLNIRDFEAAIAPLLAQPVITKTDVQRLTDGILAISAAAS